MISIKECLEIMHSGANFSLKVVRWDARRKHKRGQVLDVPCAVLVWGKPGQKNAAKGERAMTSLEKSLLATPDKRNPNHSEHYTRNIRAVVNGLVTETIYKIHPVLIIEFDGEKTVL